MTVRKRVSAELDALGLVLPPPVTPLGNYVSAVRTDHLLFFSGHGPLRVNGKPAFQGRVGREFSAEQGGDILIGATLNVLSSGQRILGDLDRIRSIEEAHAIIACSGSAVDVEVVAAPAFSLLDRLFGPIGSRRISTVTSLPNGVPGLMEAVVTLND